MTRYAIEIVAYAVVYGLFLHYGKLDVFSKPSLFFAAAMLVNDMAISVNAAARARKRA